MSNREFFCILLMFVGLYSKKTRFLDKVFIIGPNYRVDSNLDGDNDTVDKSKGILPGMILLQQQKKTTLSSEGKDIYETDDFGKRILVSKNNATKFANVGEERYYNPMDMVILQNELSGELEYVPAIYVKMLADNAEWARITEALIITGLMLSIFLSAGALATGATGFAAVAAADDIAVSSADLAVLVLRDALDEQNWFVKNWTKISVGVSIATLSPFLIKGVLKNGPKLLQSIQKAATGAD